MQPLTLSASRLQAFFKCPKYYDLHYNKNLTRPGISPKPFRGTVLHACLEELYERNEPLQLHEVFEIWDREFAQIEDRLEPGQYPEFEKTRGLVIAMAMGYQSYYSDWKDSDSVIDTEMELSATVFKAGELDENRPIIVEGKLDLVSRHDKPGLFTVTDHKSLSRTSSALFQKLDIDFQLNVYSWLAQLSGMPPAIAQYNIVGVSQIRQKRHQTISDYVDELTEIYRTPKHYNRIPIMVSDASVQRWQEDHLKPAVVYWYRNVYKGDDIFPRNTSACDTFGACSFLDWCTDSVLKDSYVQREDHRLKKQDDIFGE